MRLLRAFPPNSQHARSCVQAALLFVQGGAAVLPVLRARNALGFNASMHLLFCRVAGKPQSRGWLPTSRIAADADTVSVPVYQYPFVHDAWMRQRLSTQRHSLDTAASTAERQQVMRPNFVHVTDEHGKLHVLRPQMLLLPQTTLAEAPAKAASGAPSCRVKHGQTHQFDSLHHVACTRRVCALNIPTDGMLDVMRQS